MVSQKDATSVPSGLFGRLSRLCRPFPALTPLSMYRLSYTVKKAFQYSRPHAAGMSHTKLSLGGNYDVIYAHKLFSA
jgi:hypothetical protein